MIKLYREETSAEADAIEAEFREMVLGYDRVVVAPAETGTMFAGRSLPFVTDNERVVSGEEFRSYLKELETLARDWRLFQSDSCYVGEDGGSC